MSITDDLAFFEILCEEHEYQKYSGAPNIESYKGILPEFLLEIWKKYGLTSHGKGEIWFTDPEDFRDIVRAFFGKGIEFVVYARHSYGYMYAIREKKLYIIHPQIARAQYMGEIDTLPAQLLNILDSGPAHKSHLSALKKFGSITSEQMYGYVPMLALGGNGSLKETQIVTMREYLFLVAGTATEAIRSGWNPTNLPIS